MGIRLAIVDDHPLVQAGLRQLLASSGNIMLEAVYASGEELMSGLERSAPDVLLLDIQLPDHNGDELARIIRQRYPQVRMLALTNVDTSAYVKKMIQAGCLGYLLKNVDRDTLVQAIETVYREEQFIAPTLKEELLQDMLEGKRKAKLAPSLTRREKEILQLIAKEYTSQEIADTLFLSPNTIENHRKQLFLKLDARNMAGLIKKAVDFGLLE